MITVLKKIGVFFCLILVLFSSTSLRWEGHYCKDELKSFTFLGNADLCDMATESDSCHKKSVCPFHKKKKPTSKDNLSKKSCCSNIEFSLFGFDFEDLGISIENNSDHTEVQIYSFEQNLKSHVYNSEDIVRPPPPDIEWDYQERYEVYLI